MNEEPSQQTDPITPYAPSRVSHPNPMYESGELKHSGFAIASFWVSLVSFAITLVSTIIVVIVVFSAVSGNEAYLNSNDFKDGNFILLGAVGLFFILGSIGSLVGLVLNIICLCSAGTKKTLPIVGLILSCLVVGYFVLGIITNILMKTA